MKVIYQKILANLHLPRGIRAKLERHDIEIVRVYVTKRGNGGYVAQALVKLRPHGMYTYTRKFYLTRRQVLELQCYIPDRVKFAKL